MKKRIVQTQRLASLIALYFLVVLLGVRVMMLPEDAPVDILFWFFLGGSLTTACTADSILLGKHLTCGGRVALLMTNFVGAPFYFLWSRRWKGLLALILHGLLFFLAYCGGVFVSDFVLLNY